jgi:iron complex outermembrane receptor protein
MPAPRAKSKTPGALSSRRGAACRRPSPLERGARRAGCVLAAALLTAQLFAQTTPDPDLVVLPPWAIVETTDHHLQPAREDTFASTLGPTSVITRTTWADRSIATLAEALRRAPGVMLQESFGGFEPPRLSIRGSGLDSAPTARGVALLADGLPLARADGSFHTGLFDPQLFSRVEVYRGTMHMALTPAVLGGVLNAVSLSADAPLSPNLRLEAGSFGAARALFSAGTAKNSTTAFATASFNRADGWRDHSAQDRTALNATLRHDFSPALQLDVSTYFAAADYEVPGPLTLTDAQAQPRSVTAAVLRDLPRRDSSLARVAAQLKTPSLSAGLAWQRLRDDFYQLQANGETDSTSDDLSAHVTFSRKLTFGSTDHHLLARAIFSTGVNTTDRYLNALSQRGARFAAYDARAATAALSVEDIVWLNPTLAVGLGFTALDARRELADQLATGVLSRTLTFRDLSPRAGLTWSPRSDLTLHTALSRGVEPPTFDDLVAVSGTYPNFSLRSRDLAPQSATTFEFGARGQRGALGWSVTAYRAAWRNEILRLADTSGSPRGAVNAPRTTHTGLETSARLRLLDRAHRLTLTATSTLGRFTFDDDPVYARNRLAGAPPHTGSAELLYENPHALFAAVESTWTAGRTPVDHANRLAYGGSALLNLRAGWRPTPRFLIFATVRNLLDRPTLASTAGVLDLARTPATTAIFLPAPARAFTLALQWTP